MEYYYVVVDIGNTCTKFAFFIDSKLYSIFNVQFSYRSYKKSSYFPVDSVKEWLQKTVYSLQNILQTTIANFQIHIGFSSVVLEAEPFWKRFWKDMGMQNISILSRKEQGISFLLEETDENQTLGADRIANLLSAYHYYGKNAIIIDIGTTITFCVLKNGKYIGGYIFPGPNIALETLKEKTSLLPLVSLAELECPDANTTEIGTNTKNSIQKGIYYGYQSIIKKMISNCKKKFISNGNRPITIMAGGNTIMQNSVENNIDIIDKNLTIKGIFIYCQHYSHIKNHIAGSKYHTTHK